MKYDPQRPIAVFLGPSLPQHKAQRLLPANYYPPAAMGDVYRLIATGVRLIVLIDGVFHARTPIWQRELLAAIDHGITVVGACSMGALRAAELDRLGMIGHGEVYGWYRDGVIDGDDEVALEHADAYLGFQAISEPLVNIRRNLAIAGERGLVDAARAEAIVAEMKSLVFGARTHHRLLQTAPVLAMPQDDQLALADFLSDESTNLKQEDAIAVLRWCAKELAAGTLPAGARDATLPRASIPTVYGAFETLLRGVWRPDGRLPLLREIWEQGVATAEHLPVLVQEAAERHYLKVVAEAGGLALPDAGAHADALLAARAGASDVATWLRRAGLTRAEFVQRVAHDLREDQLLAQAAQEGAHAGTAKAVDALARWYGRGGTAADNESLRAQLSRAWAREQGIEAPAEVQQAFLARWLGREGFADLDAACAALDLAPEVFAATWSEQGQYAWMLEQTPAHFGFETWSAQREVIAQLQFDGRVLAAADALPAEEEKA
jgi:hypothetical protein